jgi:hypothetical protein
VRPFADLLSVKFQIQPDHFVIFGMRDDQGDLNDPHDIKTSDATVYRVCRSHGLRRLPHRIGRRAVRTHRYEKQVPVSDPNRPRPRVPGTLPLARRPRIDVTVSPVRTPRRGLGGGGLRGVWVGEYEIASIAVRRWVTYHGFTLNVTTDLNAFRGFNPCGLEHGVMTSLEREVSEILPWNWVEDALYDGMKSCLDL